MHGEKFIEPFINLIEQHFDFSQHIFLVRQSEKFPISPRDNVKILSERDNYFLKLLFYQKNIRCAKKIILHGLFHKEIFLFLFFQPWLLKKCYWVMWGGDVYINRDTSQGIKNKFYEIIRIFVFKNIGHFVTQIKGDYELVKKLYKSRGIYHDCFVYTSNLYHHQGIKAKKNNTLNILVGNSAVPTNNHLDILKKIIPFKEMDIKIIVPLSYGSKEHAQSIIDFGLTEFGEKFIPLTEFIVFEKYLEFLSEVDIAIFNHARQQALGNTTTLLGLGKKVYMRKDVTTWRLFENLGIKIFDIEKLDLNLINEEDAKKNQSIIMEHFSKETLIKQLTDILQ